MLTPSAEERNPAHDLAAATLARPWPECLTIPGVSDDEIMGLTLSPFWWVQALKRTGLGG